MTSRIYRRRPPKPGGTIPPTTGDTLIHSRPPYHSPNPNTNYYQVLSRKNHSHSNSTSNTNTQSVISPFRRTKRIGHCLDKSHSTNTHTNLNDFTLIKGKNRNKKSNGSYHDYDKNLKFPKCKKLRSKFQQSFNHQLVQRLKHKNLIPTTDKNNMGPESRNFSEISNKNYRNMSRYAKNTSTTSKQRKYKVSLFTGLVQRNQIQSSKMSDQPPAIKIETGVPALVSSDNTNTHPEPITIDTYTVDSCIKAIPMSQTWSTYLFNIDKPSMNENEWNELPDNDKYAQLIMLKGIGACIKSPFTTFVITPETDDKIIRKIPKKDCRLLLKAYADSQGYPDLASTIETMLVEPMRDEIIKAKEKLSTRSRKMLQDNIKKERNDELPFVLTHAITDEDIIAASESALLNELQSMYKDRNLYDSILWDSLDLSDLRDMTRMERNEMLQCFSDDDETSAKDEITSEKSEDKDPNGKKFVYVEEEDDDDDSDSNTEIEDDGDVDMHDADDEHVNESDQFIANTIKDNKKDKRTFKFSFTRETTDTEIYQLNHKRASRIAKQHSIMIEQPLSDEFFNEATTEQFYEYLKNERDEYRLEHSYENFHFSEKTTDPAIKKLNRASLEAFICYRYRDTDRLISEDFFPNKTDMELKYLLITERDAMRYNEQQLNKNKINPNDPKPPNTLPKGLRAKRQNLNGWNIEGALSTNNNNLHSKVFHPKANDTTEHSVIPMSKQYFFIRANISTEGNGTHTPTIVRRFFKALRNSDPTIQLQPFDKDDNDLNNILDSESLIPDDATAILTWVRGIYSTAKRLHFSIRVSHTCLLSELRTDIFGWCKTNRCYIDMDYINSEKLFACGWICGIHPRLYNRNDLKAWIDELDPTGNIGKKIKMYPRTIFTVDDDGKKTITNAIIIDGAVEDSKEIMQFLYNIDWSDRYNGATFVPFRTSHTLKKADQRDAMEFHNDYLHSTYRKLVKIANPNTNFELDDGEVLSFRDWLIQSKLHGMHMIEGVETMKDGLVRIIYNKQHQQGVDYIISTLQNNVIEAFGEETAKEMLGEDFDIVSRFDSEMEDQHADKIKSTWKGKTITNPNPPKKTHTIFFGSNKSERLYQPGDSKSYSEITQSTASLSDVQVADSKRENDELRQMVLDLQNKFDLLEKRNQTFTQTLKSTIKQELMNEFEGIITGIRNDMNSAITSIEAKFDNSIKQFEKNALEREQRFNAANLSNFRLAAGELLQNSTKKSPSEDTEKQVALRGGEQ